MAYYVPPRLKKWGGHVPHQIAPMVQTCERAVVDPLIRFLNKKKANDEIKLLIRCMCLRF